MGKFPLLLEGVLVVRLFLPCRTCLRRTCSLTSSRKSRRKGTNYGSAPLLRPTWYICLYFFSHIYTQDTIFGIVNNFCFVFFIFQSPLTVTLPSPEPLTAAMFLFLLNMKEPGKDPLNPKLLFNQLCQKYDAFLPYITIKSSMNSAWMCCLFCQHVLKQLCWCCTSASPAFSLSCCGDHSHQPDTGSTWFQLNESSIYTKHSQREQTSLNGLFFLCCSAALPPVPSLIQIRV